MPRQFLLEKSQLKDLEFFLTLDVEKIGQIVDNIRSLPTPPLRPSDIQGVIEKIIPNRVEEVKVFVKQLLSLCSLKIKMGIDTKELLDSLSYSIEHAEEPWSDKNISKFRALEPRLIDLFSLPEVINIVKTLSLSYDYTNFSQSMKILTDIRPVYNEDAKEILGAIISYTLRLYYQDVEGQKNISIALDDEDVYMLLKSCERALTKANTAQRFMKDQGRIETLVRGKEN